MLNPDIRKSSLNELLFDLLYSTMKEDLYPNRVKAFAKRLLQNASHAQPPFVISTLLLISRLIPDQPLLKVTQVKLGLKESAEEKLEIEEVTDGRSKGYDPLKREPLYSNALNTEFWELTILSRHYHPTVRAMTEQLLAGKTITY